jgi:radical SAM protein with 4Fe4S-binding SPASM domain
LNKSDEEQISTTDTESKALLLHRNIVEVAYNVQSAVDDKHSLIVHTEATNRSDRNALHGLASEAKKVVEKELITVLADKGYHHGRELHQCAEQGITTVVAYKVHVDGNENGPHPTYYVEHFVYDKEKDHYTCPNGSILTTSGSWHNKKKENSPYQFKKYRTPDCRQCPVKHLCTGRKGGREIERSQYQDAVDRNNERIQKQKELYLKRQAIVEHPFGTIKRSWGYSYTLLKGLRKVDGEMNLIALVYNLRRAMNIMGSDRLIKALNKWTPNYEKVLHALKKTIIRSLYIYFKPIRFLQPQYLHKNGCLK